MTAFKNVDKLTLKNANGIGMTFKISKVIEFLNKHILKRQRIVLKYFVFQ